jgi:hypothetical protein
MSDDVKVANQFREPKDTTGRERDYESRLGDYFEGSVGSTYEKLWNFPKYAPRQSVARFLSRYELFQRVLNVHGSIVECGVLFGGGVMAFAQLSAIFEPVNHQRKIVGFDTFSGFAGLDAADASGRSSHLVPGGLAVDSYEDLGAAIKLFDQNRFLGHIDKVELVRGDVRETVPAYIKANPQLVVSLLYLDMDIYAPTKTALESFLPRIPKGGIIAFDELNAVNWPGETVAVMETVGLSGLRLQRFSFDSFVSFAVIE